MKKKIRVFICLLMILIIFIPIHLIAPSVTDTVSCTRVGGGCDTYFIGEKLGINLLSIDQGDGIFGPRVLKVISGDYSSLCILNSSGTQHAAFIDNQSVNIYVGGRLLSKYTITSTEDEILGSFVSDIDNDKSDEILLLTRHKDDEYGNQLVILSYNGSFTEVFKKPVESLNPWKVQVCDIDGDGTQEISLGVYTVSAYRKDLAKRPFIYNLKDGSLYPKWLGSRLSKPFDDYIFSDIDGDNMDELLSIEVLKDGRKEITAYKWTGFGFEGIGNSEAFDDIKSIKHDGEGIKPYSLGISPYCRSIRAMVFDNNRWMPKYFRLAENRLIE